MIPSSVRPCHVLSPRLLFPPARHEDVAKDKNRERWKGRVKEATNERLARVLASQHYLRPELHCKEWEGRR